MIGSQPVKSQIVSDKLLVDTKYDSTEDLPIPETFSSLVSKNYRVEVGEFINQLSNKQHRYQDQRDFLRFIFYKVHSKYLRHYKNFATFEDLYQRKAYDCVTGTALYSWIFDHLGVEYKVMETTFHIYLLIANGDDPIIVESTNPVEGFISDPDKVSSAMETYTKDGSPVKGSNNYYQIDQPVDNQITVKELLGLYYHNMAVEAYNRKDLSAALILQEKAFMQYPSGSTQRIDGCYVEHIV